MRPALHANILRHRSQRARRLYNRPHTFSLSRLLMIVFVGGVLFIPGLALTIIGIKEYDDYESKSPGKRIMYKAIGPTMCTLGVGMLFGAVVYYCCYAVGDQSRHATSQQTSMLSPDKAHQQSHGSIRSHHENGSHRGSADGVTRRPSYKGEHSPSHHHFTSHHHHHHYHHPKSGSDDEAVPLAPSENFSTIDTPPPTHPTVSITVEDVDCPTDPPSPSHEDTELILNGGVRTDAPKV